MTMAAVPGVLSYGPNLHILCSKLGILFFLEMVSHLFACMCVLALALCLCFALVALFLPCFSPLFLFLSALLSFVPFFVFPWSNIYFVLTIYCVFLCRIISNKYIYINCCASLVYFLSLKSSSNVLHIPTKLPLPVCTICHKFLHLHALHLSD
jgi:hypothetical protein